MRLLAEYSYIVKVIVTLLLSIALVALVLLFPINLVQWLALFVSFAGVYFLLDSVIELITHQKSDKQNETRKVLFEEVLHQPYTPCILFSLESLDIQEINLSASKLIKSSLKHELKKLTDIFPFDEQPRLANWINKNKYSYEYSNITTKVTLKNRQGKVIPKLAKLTFIPVDGVEPVSAIIKVEVKAKVLDHESQSHNLLRNIDITRHAAGTAYWELDLSNGLLYFSSLVGELLGLDESFSSPVLLSELESKADCAIFKYAEQMFAQGMPENYINAQKMIIDRSGNQKFVVMQAHYYEFENVILGTLYDMTSIKESEIKLRQREHQMNQLIDSIPEGIFVLQDSKIVFLNRAALKLFGFKYAEHAHMMLLSEFISDADKTLLRDRIKYMLAGKKRSYGFTSFKLKKYSGELFDAEVAVNLIIYEGRESIQFVIRDLTEVLRVKNALAKANFRLSALSSKTLQLIETERKQIAGELHDDVGQSLTAVLLATKWLTRRIEDEELLEKISDIHLVTSQTLETVRNLSLLLRPAQLDSLGFSPAIKWQMDKLLSIADIEYELDDRGFTEIADKQAEIVGFRIIQESLTNIVKHANAKYVKVTIRSDNKVLALHVKDDGIGFDVHAQNDSVGLVNMKERVELAGGEFKIFSQPSMGTDIKVEIPLRNDLLQLESKESVMGEFHGV